MDLVSIQGMGEFEVVLDHYIRRKTIIKIECECGKVREVRVEAVYRQKKRGRSRYLCPSCAGKLGWSDSAREEASKRTKQQWNDPTYAGTITGKAIAKEVIRMVNSH